MTDQFLPRKVLLAILLASIVAALGCEQQRYQPAVWKPAGTTGTLPATADAVNDSGAVSAGTLPIGSTLAMRNGTLPVRMGTLPLAGSTLPLGTTLAARQDVYRPSRKDEFKKPPLPNIDVQEIWDASPKEQMSNVKGKPGLYSFGGGFRPLSQTGRGSTLPSRGFGSGSTLPGNTGFGSSTLPMRTNQFGAFGGTGSTLPSRGFGSPIFGGSTTPVRGSTLPAGY